MAPNLALLSRKVFRPFSSPSTSPSTKAPRRKSVRRTEHWEDPVPGLYEYIPGRGWFLIKRDSTLPDETLKREPVVRCSILHRWILKAELDQRICMAKTMDDQGKIRVKRLFQLDDGVGWINCWDEDGLFDPGPWERLCADEKTGIFRKMLIGDDPGWRRRRERACQLTEGEKSGSVFVIATTVDESP
ncbi:MAG: hypothetical protein M1837_004860 [Sclerophora amabilis]|nr:MAG: hypothetical protein M1837_004860 [Sclerophora amabilis]